MYTYEEFKNVIAESLENELGEDKKISVRTVYKNNQKKREGIMVQEEGSLVSPVVYLDDLYDKYCITEDIFSCLEFIQYAEENKKAIKLNGILNSWPEVKERIELQIINWSWNEKRLSAMPHRKFLDLAIIYRVSLGKSLDGTMSAEVKNDMMEEWGINEEQLWIAALDNLVKEKFVIKDMDEIVAEIIGVEVDEQELSGNMYVMSTETRMNGAAGLLRIDLLEEFAAKRKQCYFILPSSLHDLIFVPEDQCNNVEALQAIVWEVNQENVKLEERLSNQVYYFNGKTVQIAQAA